MKKTTTKKNVQTKNNSKRNSKSKQIPMEQLIGNTPEALFNKPNLFKSKANANTKPKVDNPTRIGIACGAAPSTSRRSSINSKSNNKPPKPDLKTTSTGKTKPKPPTLNSNPYNPKISRTQEEQKLNNKLAESQKKMMDSVQKPKPITTPIKNDLNNNNINSNNKNGKINEQKWGKIVSERKSVKLSPEELMRLLRDKHGIGGEEDKKDEEPEVPRAKNDILIDELLKSYEPDYVNPKRDEENIQLRAKSFEKFVIIPTQGYKRDSKRRRPLTFVEKVRELDRKEEEKTNKIIQYKHSKIFNPNKSKNKKPIEINIISKIIEKKNKEQNDLEASNKFKDLSKKFYSSGLFDIENKSNTNRTESSYKNKYLNKYIYGSKFKENFQNGSISKKSSSSNIIINRRNSNNSNNYITNREYDSSIKSDFNLCLSERNNKNYNASIKIYPQNDTSRCKYSTNNIVNSTYNNLILKNNYLKNKRYEEDSFYDSFEKSHSKFHFSFNGLVNHIENKITEIKSDDGRNSLSSKYRDYSLSTIDNYSNITDGYLRKNTLEGKNKKFKSLIIDVNSKIGEMKRRNMGMTERNIRPSFDLQISNMDNILARRRSLNWKGKYGGIRSKQRSLLEDIRDLAEGRRRYRSKNYL